VKSYVRNTINLSWDKILLTSVMYGSSYIFRQYIAIFSERSQCLLRDAQLSSSRKNIVDGRVVSSDVVRAQGQGILFTDRLLNRRFAWYLDAITAVWLAMIRITSKP
jgi:hypothetical protein